MSLSPDSGGQAAIAIGRGVSDDAFGSPSPWNLKYTGHDFG